MDSTLLVGPVSKSDELEVESINKDFRFGGGSVVLLSVAHDVVVLMNFLNMVVFAIGSWMSSAWMHTGDSLVKLGISGVAVVVIESSELTMWVELRLSRARSWILWHELAIISGRLRELDSTFSKDIVQVAEVSVVIVMGNILGHRRTSNSALVVVSVSKVNKLEPEVINPFVSSL